MRLSEDFDQCDTSTTRIDVGCQEGKRNEAKDDEATAVVTPSKTNTMVGLSCRYERGRKTKQQNTLMTVETKRVSNSGMRQTTLRECRPYYLRRESKVNFTKFHFAGKHNVGAAIPVSDEVHNKKLLVPSKTEKEYAKTYTKKLTTQRKVNSNDKTCTPNTDRDIGAIGTYVSCSIKVKAHNANNEADAKHSTYEDAWNGYGSNCTRHGKYTDPAANEHDAQSSDKSSTKTNEDSRSVGTSRRSANSYGDDSEEEMGDTVNGSSSIESNNSHFLPTDESFNAYHSVAEDEWDDDDWVAKKVQRPTAALRRKKLYGDAASLSNSTDTKSVAPQICHQNITDTSVPNKQFLIQFDRMYKRMTHRVKSDIKLILEEVEGHYGWMAISNQKRTLVEKHIQDLKREQYEML